MNVITWRWAPPSGYRSSYPPETVNRLYAMVRKHYPGLGRFICVTDQPAGIDPAIEILPAWNDFEGVPSPHGAKNPSCYRRLRLFHPDAAQWFGERYVSLDLDVVLTADPTPLWERPEDVVFYGDTNKQPGSHYNGSMMLVRAGSRPDLWTRFDPVESPKLTVKARCWGSDQGWISYCLGNREAKWSRADGVYSFRNDLQGKPQLPANARLIVFHGKHDPWSPWVHRNYPWVPVHYGPMEVAA